MILGDSFAEGVPFDNENDITGILRKSANYNSINYGINGTGPLISLAIIKEYGKKFVPKNVFYLFYEGLKQLRMVYYRQILLLEL